MLLEEKLEGRKVQSLPFLLSRNMNYHTLKNEGFCPNEVIHFTTIKLDATYYRYDHPKNENWDNEYLFANLDYTINFNTGFRLNMGLRFNNIEIPSALYDGYFGYFFNSEWQISKILRVNLGYQSKADHYSYSVNSNPTVYHMYDVTSQSIYLKTSVSF